MWSASSSPPSCRRARCPSWTWASRRASRPSCEPPSWSPRCWGARRRSRRRWRTWRRCIWPTAGAHVHFALLSDFLDAPTETRPEDAAIEAAAVEGVRALNARYAADHPGRLLPLPSAPPLERAPGGLDGVGAKTGQAGPAQPVPARRPPSAVRPGPSAPSSATSPPSGEPATSSRSTPTRCLPPDAAQLLVGTLAHPLNRPVYDSASAAHGRRLRDHPAAGGRVAALRAPIALLRHSLRPPGRGPLHDRRLGRLPGPLRRGQLHRQGDLRRRRVRAGHPRAVPGEHAAVARPHRGQLRARRAWPPTSPSTTTTPPATRPSPGASTAGSGGTGSCWAGSAGRVPGPDGPERNRLSLLSRWKILDNLRRSTTEIAQLLFLLAGWTVLPGSPLRWTLLGLGLIAAPWLVSLLLALVRPPPTSPGAPTTRRWARTPG